MLSEPYEAPKVEQVETTDSPAVTAAGQPSQPPPT